ncbi:MAG: DNA cytosine methyltransferase [Prevotella sp.]|nr:DNA cytosine methyltransferase [Prevotella sp.]MCM1075169.1 DNA cytosine methyltransferase [Ruminococcus sp.]
MNKDSHIPINNFADIAGVSRATVDKWIKSGKCTLHQDCNGEKYLIAGELASFPEIASILQSDWVEESKVIPNRVFTSAELFDGGRTLGTIKDMITELGYTLVEPRVMRAIMYNVPQKRERLILIAIRNDIAPFVEFKWPDVFTDIRTLRDAFYADALYDCDVPESEGEKYPEKKKEVLKLVPEGGDWRDLPPEVAEAYMKGSYRLGGGKTGMASRLAMDEASLTLTCAPAHKQTERCHPIHTRPLTVREYARIQTFPDDWEFSGSLSSKYKQIGNAVPVNMAWALGRSIMRLFNQIDTLNLDKEKNVLHQKYHPVRKLHGLFEGLACESEAEYNK